MGNLELIKTNVVTWQTVLSFECKRLICLQCLYLHTSPAIVLGRGDVAPKVRLRCNWKRG
jgi:hypothetical protein